MDLIEQITSVATSLGWHVGITSATGIVEFEFSQYTPAGQDFNFCVEMKDETSIVSSIILSDIMRLSTQIMKPPCGLAMMGTAKEARPITSRTS